MKAVLVYNYTGGSWNGGVGFAFPAGGPFPITYAQYDDWIGVPPYPKAVIIEKRGTVISFVETNDFTPDYFADFEHGMLGGIAFVGLMLTVRLLRWMRAGGPSE